MQFKEWKTVQTVISLPRSAKRAIMVMTDTLLIPTALYTTHALITNQLLFEPSLHQYLLATILVAASIPIFARLGLYHAIVRFMGDKAVLAVTQATTIATLIYLLATQLLSHTAITPYLPGDALSLQTAPLIPSLMVFWGVLILMLGGTRLAMRHLIHLHQARTKHKIIIYGAGQTGTELLRAMKSGHQYQPIAFVDDNTQLQKSVIDGIRIFSPSKLETLLKTHDVRQILLAMPNISRSRKRHVINSLEEYPVQVKTIPCLADIMAGKARISDIRDIDIEDLLGRDPIDPAPKLMTACIHEQTVLVTGAGGSIGSELCRQIIQQKPKRLLLLDSCEFALYSIERELLALTAEKQTEIKTTQLSNDKIISLLANVQDRARLDTIFNTFEIDTVYHAAAFKHVPMVEHNIVDGVKNNVFGTLNTALAARENNVSTFVLVSTDKAVRPTNVMGTTKRLAEMTLQALADSKHQSHKTLFCMVRFGNVLGSSGSVVPLFREQINTGGPITVTHPEVIRYFMTITEASQLVIQAGSMAKGGEVFVLDMGDPVKIDSLAKKMIRLMGKEVKDQKNPRGDIEIRYTGLRPGEKLYEELLIGDNPTGTSHQRIMKAQEGYLTWKDMETLLENLKSACEKHKHERLIELMLREETGFIPRQKLDDHIYRKVLEREAENEQVRKVRFLKTGA